jgi:hypothetical protein
VARQESLSLYGKGIIKTRAGHLRYTSPVHLRGQYVHRKVIADCIDATPYSIKLLLPWPYEVHHMDYNKEHNCPSNLLATSEALHSAMTADRRREQDGKFAMKFRPKWTKPPEWLPFDDPNEVPF